MFTVSRTALEAVLRDIRNGVEYPDFWTNRYGDEEQTAQPEQEPDASTQEATDEDTTAAQA